ncbi:MAG: hypothetical protein IJB31_00585 [Akkermansia sp.]|nr:hypothetical protein [Akkermansia sp.]
MALHIQMSDEAEKELRRAELRNKLSSIGACLLFMLLGGGLLVFTTIYIAGEIPAEFISYVPPAEDGPPSNAPVQKELTQKSSAPTAEVSPSVIVAQGATAVNMAPVNISTSEGLDFNTDIDMGLSMDGDLGAGLGDGGSGLGSGTAGGSALTGTLYDIKRTRTGSAPRDGIKLDASGHVVQADQYKLLEAVHNFTKTWSAGSLERYYKAKKPLYASNFMMPSCAAGYAPIAFGEDEKTFKPAAWVLVYRGKVRAPKTGKFRFIGVGDDFLGVRFDRKTVLEAGWIIPSTYEKGKYANVGTSKAYKDAIKAGSDSKHRGYQIIPMDGIPNWNSDAGPGGLVGGTVFDVKEGQVYPIEICMSEIGGLFGFALLIEELDSSGKSKAKYDNKGKVLNPEQHFDLFRTNFSMPNEKELLELINKTKFKMKSLPMPKYNPDSLIWTAVP